MKRKTLPIVGTPSREKKIKTNTPKIYNNLIREVTLQTYFVPQKSNALFDTGANIFVLDNQWAAQFSLSYLERDEPLLVFRFSGQQDHTAGKYFAPFLTIIIGQHETNISAELGTLEEGIDLIIPRGWFLVEHPMTFENGKIKVQQHICQKNEEITYDETLLEDKDAIIIGSMTYFAPPDHESLKKIIPTEYHHFLHLFG